MASSMILTITLMLTVMSLMQIVQSFNETGNRDGLLRINLIRASRQTPVDHVFKCQYASIDEPPSEDDGCHVKKMNMLSYKSFNYIGEIWVGQPAKRFRVLLDSGSADLWLLAKNCSSSNVDQTTIMATYDWTQSSSFQNDGRPISIRYGNGVTVSGRLARDNIQMGDLLIKNQTFVQIDETSTTSHLQYYHMDGIMGLGLRTIFEYPDLRSPIYSMMQEAARQSNGLASKQMLSLSLNHQSTDSQKAGELIIGGLDHSRYVGEITWAPLVHSSQWRFRVESIELNFMHVDEQPIVNKVTVCPHGCQVTADTGTTLIIGNAGDIQMLNERIGAFHVARGVYTLASCEGLNSRLPQLVVTISGTRFSLKPSQYTYQVKGICYSGFKGMDHEYPWVLGGLFLGHFYTIMDYDNHRFGLAESATRSEASIISH